MVKHTRAIITLIIMTAGWFLQSTSVTDAPGVYRHWDIVSDIPRDQSYLRWSSDLQ